MTNSLQLEHTGATRVLVFTVDDGLVCIDLNWVEAIHRRGDIALHAAKPATGAARAFLVHRGEPAVLVDPREAFGLDDLLPVPDREAVLVVRSGATLVALQIDAGVGVRDLDLQTRTPLASALLRDGGSSIGHLVDLDGRLHAILEPSRILSTALAQKLEPALQAARVFCERERTLTALVAELRRAPTAAALKSYARLSRRNGHTRAAAAARAVLKAVQDSERHQNGGVTTGDIAAGTFLRDLVTLSMARETGDVLAEVPEPVAIHYHTGRIVDATGLGEHARSILKRVLAARQGTYRFVPSDVPPLQQRIDTPLLWLLTDTIEQLSDDRRGRHGR